MPQDKPIHQMTQDELRQGLVEYMRSQQPTPPPAPLPPGVDRDSLTPGAADILARNWAGSILEKNVWTPAEREAVRSDILRVLREMGR